MSLLELLPWSASKHFRFSLTGDAIFQSGLLAGLYPPGKTQSPSGFWGAEIASAIF